MKNIVVLSLIFSGLLSFSYAQQVPQFTHYMFNQFYYNPAVAGIDAKNIDVKLFHRSQWAGYDGEGATWDGSALSTQLLTFSMPLNSIKGGLGVHILNEQFGPVTKQEIQAAFSYYIPVKKGSLSFGLRTGLFNLKINDELVFVDDSDNLATSSGTNNMALDFSAGVYFNQPSYFIGVAFQHLQQSDIEDFYSLALHANGIAGVNWDISNTVTLQPSILMKTDMKNYSFEGSILAIFNNLFYTGVAMREVESFSFLAGAFLTHNQRLSLGYAFDYVLQQENAKMSTSHEIMLSYRFPSLGKSEPSILRTPRFRF